MNSRALTDIHFAVDTRSSGSHTTLLAVTAHFVDGDTSRPATALLALRELHGGHGGEDTAEIMLVVIDEYSIRDKVGYFNFDNVSSNDKMMRVLARSFKDFDPVVRRLRCNGHIINLAVEAFLFGKNKEASAEAIRQIQALSANEQRGNVSRIISAAEWRKLGPLGKLHNLVIFIRSSDQRYRAFISRADRMIPRDNSTR